MDNVKTTRRYHSPRRQEQAAATRAVILEHARSLFAKQGYGSTSIAVIARSAGVAVQTIYSIFGSKQGIIGALLDAVEEQAEIAQLAGNMGSTRDPRKQLGHMVRFHRHLWERGADVIQTVLAAGDVDAELAATAREGDRRRRETESPVVRAWYADGALRPELEVERAIDIIWTMTSPQHYVLLVVGCGWSSDEYESWLIEALASLLFGEDA